MDYQQKYFALSQQLGGGGNCEMKMVYAQNANDYKYTLEQASCIIKDILKILDSGISSRV